MHLLGKWLGLFRWGIQMW